MKKVLIVEDCPSTTMILTGLLQRQSLDVTAAESGEAAMALLHDGLVPDLIFTDLNMDGMTGLELTQQVRAMPALKSVPILFLTAESKDEIKQQARAYHAQGWLVKPFSADKLVAVVEKFLA